MTITATPQDGRILPPPQPTSAPPLFPTLPTWAGMVLNNGHPTQRSIPYTIHTSLETHPQLPTTLNMPIPVQKPRGTRPGSGANIPRWAAFDIPQDYVDLVEQCVQEGKIPAFENSPARNRQVQQLRANVWTMLGESGAQMQMLKRFVRERKRIDLEQAAGLVVGVLVNELGAGAVGPLVGELKDVIFRSDMWLEAHNVCDGISFKDRVLGQRFQKVKRIVEDKFNVPLSRTGAGNDSIYNLDWSFILPVLLRIRRKRHLLRLDIPAWIFEKANVPIPDYSAQDLRDQGISAPLPPNTILLPVRQFRRLKRFLNRLTGRQDPETLFRNAIHDLEDQILYGTNVIDTVMNSTDPVAVAWTFFSIQRRLQLKVVSDVSWTDFLKKGESSMVLQNNPNTLSSFEVALAELAKSRMDADWETLTAVRCPPGLGSLVSESSHILEQIDQCCVLMERYVTLFGKGDMGNLVFKVGVYGGSGRGPVDDYNLLCDVLAQLRRMYKEAAALEGVEEVELPGPCHKFLAKDIMAYNQSWGDDAFANGKVPGWVGWLQRRRAEGIVRALGECVLADK
ncbi:hypothetical protein HK102_006673 [Quaeritorhiza haematococci]|nr:hypothetical protein HK102_006673 [Quaeritorhiza haematococci]